jgi:Porin subfamily
MFRPILVAVAVFASAAPALAGGKGFPQCSQYGPGFVYSPDTGMCIKVSGDFRADYTFGKQNSRFGSTVDGTADIRGDTGFGPFRAVVEPRASKY